MKYNRLRSSLERMNRVARAAKPKA
ncbi:MAG: hypothetical protein JWQ11_3924, partial [Rhizobacter sp.]|nr:hypothetical protein [Rhizobacter sp.]